MKNHSSNVRRIHNGDEFQAGIFPFSCAKSGHRFDPAIRVILCTRHGEGLPATHPIEIYGRHMDGHFDNEGDGIPKYCRFSVLGPGRVILKCEVVEPGLDPQWVALVPISRLTHIGLNEDGLPHIPV